MSIDISILHRPSKEDLKYHQNLIDDINEINRLSKDKLIHGIPKLKKIYYEDNLEYIQKFYKHDHVNCFLYYIGRISYREPVSAPKIDQFLIQKLIEHAIPDILYEKQNIVIILKSRNPVFIYHIFNEFKEFKEFKEDKLLPKIEYKLSYFISYKFQKNLSVTKKIIEIFKDKLTLTDGNLFKIFLNGYIGILLAISQYIELPPLNNKIVILMLLNAISSGLPISLQFCLKLLKENYPGDELSNYISMSMNYAIFMKNYAAFKILIRFSFNDEELITKQTDEQINYLRNNEHNYFLESYDYDKSGIKFNLSEDTRNPPSTIVLASLLYEFYSLENANQEFDISNIIYIYTEYKYNLIANEDIVHCVVILAIYLLNLVNQDHKFDFKVKIK
jgi:hypothetical protein